MSFSKSNLTSGSFLTNLTKTNGIASTYDEETSTGKLYYSLDGGSIWCLAKSVPNTSFVTGLSLTGQNGILNAIAAGIDNITFYPLIYYSTNSGQSWTLSESGLPGLSSTEVYKMFVNIIGLIGVIAVQTGESNVLVYYSIDGGINWNQSINQNTFFPFDIPDAAMNNSAISIYGDLYIYVLTITLLSPNYFCIYNSKNGGKDIFKAHTLYSFNTYPNALAMSGPVALLGGINQETNSGYVYKSVDTGTSWSITINDIPNTYFKSVSLEVIYGKDLVINESDPEVNNITAMIAGFDQTDLTCKIYYTTTILDATWRRNTLTNQIIPLFDFFNSIFLFGRYGIAGSGFDNGIYFSTDFGKSWSQSDIKFGNILSVFLSGLNGIAGSGSEFGIFYTVDGGKIWNQSIVLGTNNPIFGNFNSVYLFGNDGIAGSGSDQGIWYTKNKGINWSPSSLNSSLRSFNSITLSGLNGIAGSNSKTGIYYTIDKGKNWIQSDYTNINISSVSLYELNGIAGGEGLSWTDDGGKIWNTSNLVDGTYNLVNLRGNNGIASNNLDGLYYSTNLGQSWFQSNLKTGKIFL